MTTEDATAPMKKPRSEAQVQSLEMARAKARELRTQKNVIREKHGITDETVATPTDDTETENTETENTETESESASEDEEPKPAAAAVVDEKPKPVKKEKLIKPKTDPALKPKRQATPYQPQQKKCRKR